VKAHGWCIDEEKDWKNERQAGVKFKLIFDGHIEYSTCMRDEPSSYMDWCIYNWVAFWDSHKEIRRWNVSTDSPLHKFSFRLGAKFKYHVASRPSVLIAKVHNFPFGSAVHLNAQLSSVIAVLWMKHEIQAQLRSCIYASIAPEDGNEKEKRERTQS
jgi:hypothetical protein